MPRTSSRGARAWRAFTRALRFALACLGIVLLFVAALVASVLLHLSSAPARRIGVRQVNALLADLFRGRVTIEEVREFRLDGVGGARATVYDPQGRPVLHVEGLTARVALRQLLASILRGHGDIAVYLSSVEVDRAEVELFPDPSGEPSIAAAFGTKPSPAPPPPPSPAPTPPSRGVRVTVRHAAIATAHARSLLPHANEATADLFGLTGSVSVLPEGITIDVDQGALHVRAPLGPTLDADGDFSGRLAIPSWAGRDVGVSARFDGAVGGIPVHAGGTFDGERLSATLDAPDVDPEKLRAIVPDAPLYDRARAHVVVGGTLPELFPRATLEAGGAFVDVSGAVTLGPRTRAEVRLLARDVDARTFTPDAPATKATLFGRAEATIGPGDHLSGTYALQMHPTTILGEHVPGIRVRGKLRPGHVSGNAMAQDHGVAVDLGFDVHGVSVGPGQRDTAVDFDARAVAPDLGAVPPLRKLHARGKVEARGKGRLLVSGGRVTADVVASAERVEIAGNQIANAQVLGHVAGPLSSPVVSASIVGTDTTLVGQHFDRVIAGGRTTISGAPTFEDTTVRLERSGATASAHARTLQLARGGVRAEGIVVEGLGAPMTGSVELQGARRAITLKGHGVELARVAALFGHPEVAPKGRGIVDIDLVAGPRSTKGHLTVDVTDVSLPGGPLADAHVAFEFDGARATGTAKASVDGFGAIRIDAYDVDVHGSHLNPAAWTQATGEVQLAADLNLTALPLIVPQEKNPFGESAGRLRAFGIVRRAKPSDVPSVVTTIWTRGLELSGPETAVAAAGAHTRATRPGPGVAPASPTEPEESTTWRSTDLDVELGAYVNGASGEALVGVRLVDERGLVASFDASGTVPLAVLRRSPHPLRAELEAVPMVAHLEVPERAFKDLPPIVRLPELKGRFRGRFDLRGPLRDPVVGVELHAQEVVPAFSREANPFDVDLAVSYDAAIALGRAVLTGKDARRVEASVAAHVPLDEVLEPKEGRPIPWEASAALRFQSLPLQTFPMLARRNVRGRVDGEMVLRGLHEDARFEAALIFQDTRVGRARFDRGAVHVAIDDGKMDAAARFEHRARGFVDAAASLPTVWGAELTPRIDLERGAEIRLRADDFRAAALLPLLVGLGVSDVDGRIDADAHLRVDPGLATGSMTGGIQLRQGRVEVPILGQQLKNIAADVTMPQWGELRLDGVEADAVTGHLSGSALASFDRSRLREARVTLKVPRDDEVPLSLEGVPLGNAWGEVHVVATQAEGGKKFDVDVRVPSFHIELPRSIGHSVQSLDDEPTIRIGTYRPRGDFVVLPLRRPRPKKDEEPPTRLRVALHLGKNVEVTRDPELRVYLTGDPVLEVDEQARLSGVVRITSGVADIQGKKFTIDHGTITFEEDPANPTVFVTAHWDAPDGTRVFADVIGPVKDIDVNLRSEPARSQNEILSLILFGSVQGGPTRATSGRSLGAGAQAVGVAGGYVTQAFNRVLSGVSKVDIQARIDTSNAQNPRPEVGVQVAKDVVVQVAYNLGLPAPGENPDRTMLIIDWRFVRNWSLRTTVGDRGSSILDLLWQYRY